jgi:hypothetical protein
LVDFVPWLHRAIPSYNSVFLASKGNKYPYSLGVIFHSPYFHLHAYWLGFPVGFISGFLVPSVLQEVGGSHVFNVIISLRFWHVVLGMWWVILVFPLVYSVYARDPTS